jgi:hypothetical protein
LLIITGFILSPLNQHIPSLYISQKPVLKSFSFSTSITGVTGRAQLSDVVVRVYITPARSSSFVGLESKMAMNTTAMNMITCQTMMIIIANILYAYDNENNSNKDNSNGN